MSVLVVVDVSVSSYTGQGIAEVDMRDSTSRYANSYLVPFSLDLVSNPELFKKHVEQHIRQEKRASAFDGIRGLTWNSVSFE